MSRPLLKWAGGKARLAPRLEEAFGERCRGTYFEPFIGSGAFYLHRAAVGRVGESVLSDANGKLVELHRAIRDRLDDVLEELTRLPVEDHAPHYYAVRDAFNTGPHHGPRHAARFLWLNRAGFNGLYRENRDGDFNVPCGKYKRVQMPDESHFREVSALLQPAELRVGGFQDIVKLAGRGDQVYCDPPYVPLTQSAAFTAYCKVPFGLREQVQLAEASMAAADRGAKVVLSNHDLPIVRQAIYPEKHGFRIFDRPAVSRAISRDVASRKPIAEVIACIGPFRLVA